MDGVCKWKRDRNLETRTVPEKPVTENHPVYQGLAKLGYSWGISFDRAPFGRNRFSASAVASARCRT
jgi:hypothetical protein